MQDIADYFQQRKTISWCLQQDKELWDKVGFGLLPDSKQNKKAEKVLKLYYYKCYEPIRQKMYPQKKQLNEFEQDIVGFAAAKDFTKNYLDSSLPLFSNNEKSLLCDALAVSMVAGIFFAPDDLLKIGANLGAVGFAVTAVYLAKKEKKDSADKMQYKNQPLTQKSIMSKKSFFNLLNTNCEDFYIAKHFKTTHNKQKSNALIR